MYIKVKATPDAKKENLIKVSDVSYKISVKEPARQNLANKRIVELLATAIGKPVGKIRIISGHHSPGKILSVMD